MKCQLCNKEYKVETRCVSSETEYDDENKEWVSIQGFVERRKCCKVSLGEGYGDVDYYNTEQEANKNTNDWKLKISKWF